MVQANRIIVVRNTRRATPGARGIDHGKSTARHRLPMSVRPSSLDRGIPSLMNAGEHLGGREGEGHTGLFGVRHQATDSSPTDQLSTAVFGAESALRHRSGNAGIVARGFIQQCG